MSRPHSDRLCTSAYIGPHDDIEYSGVLGVLGLDGKTIFFDVDNYSGTMIGRPFEFRDANFVDGLREDERHVLIALDPPETTVNTQVVRFDTDTGDRVESWRLPVRRGEAMIDDRGTLRLAWGKGRDRRHSIFHRAHDESEWTLVAESEEEEPDQLPIGFSADGSKVLLLAQCSGGPGAIEAWNPADGTRTTIYRHAYSDPIDIIYKFSSKQPVGVVVDDGRPKTYFFGAAADSVGRYRRLESAFADDRGDLTSWSSDGRHTLIQLVADRNPGDFYLFDLKENRATHLLSSSPWLDPHRMASMQPISLRSRDGMTLRGFLTKPPKAGPQPGPLIVLPHGVPYDVVDRWGYDGELQMLAAAGYSILQINFRGSGGYGVDFVRAGKGQWGKAMQDDVTDATRWAIEQGHADPKRICIYGASYGGYAALMGAAKESDLYRCAVGYVGVYDLPMLKRIGDIRRTRSGKNYIAEWIGDPASAAGASPTRMADRIRIPVFLAAGGKDERAPIEHSKKMEAALRAAGIPVQTLYYEDEGHGFATRVHQREYYRRLLNFFADHLGGRRSTATSAAHTDDAERMDRQNGAQRR